MSTAFAPTPWPAPAPAVGSWRAASPAPAPVSLAWVMRRNCSVSPRQLVGAYGGLFAFSIALAVAFWVLGAPYVLAFAGLEQLAVGAALLVWARHASDRETVTFRGSEVEVEQHIGRHVERTVFRAEWLSVEPAVAQGSMVELAGQGRRVRIGRHLRPELRAGLARELRRALRRVMVGLPPQESELELQR